MMKPSGIPGNKVYIKIFKRFIILAFTIFFLDFITGSLLKIYYFKQDSGSLYRTTYSLENTTADLLIFGSSTATHNYDPEIFQNRLNLSYYNVGRDGNSIFYYDAVLKAVLKRYRPKIIICDFGAHELSKDQESYDRLSCLLPYYKTHPEIRSIVNLKSPNERYKMISNIYPYNSLIFTILVGNLEFNKTRRGDMKGFLPLTDIWNTPITDGNTFLNYQLDTNKINTYKSFIEDCITSKVQLYIICSPLYIKPNYINTSVQLGKEIAEKYHVKFFDYSKDSTFLNTHSLFADVAHLNINGAKIYSNEIADSLLIENYASK
jgi:hypothetical protein